MKKRSIIKRLSYKFDLMMSKGPIAMSILLFTVTAATIVIIGILAFFVSDEGGILNQLWNTLMCAMDAGSLAEASPENMLHLLLMFIATLCGLFVTSMLIGIIANGVESKLNDLQKGTSVVQEDDHTVIIGFDSGIYSILRELILANENKKKAHIVVLGEIPKADMEDAISSNIPDTGTTQIICRSGGLHENYALERCSVETSKSVIINVHNDSETIKILLALTSYLKDKQLKNPELRFIASLQEPQYIEAANIAGGGHAAIISANDAIARIISNTCRQHGLSRVLTELFNFSGNELYFENIPQLDGKSFRESLFSFSNAIPVGLCTDGIVKLNPSMETVIKKSDSIILLELDDGAYTYHPAKVADDSEICNNMCISAKASDHLIVLGSNDKLPIILEEYSKYASPGTKVVIVDDDFNTETLDVYNNLDISVCDETVTQDMLRRFLDKNTNNVLLLNDDSLDSETSDSQTLLRLILIRDIADKAGLQLAITTEMRSIENQRLASCARVDDFVIGSDFTNLLIAQVSENPNLIPLIDDLLDEDGSELYMKPASEYVTIGVQTDCYTLTESAARKGEIFLGYRLNGKSENKTVINPDKTKAVTFDSDDQIVVVSEN